jgi:hypothetical protein
MNELASPGDHIHGWMDGHELHWLYETAKHMESVVEIGSWRGRSAFSLCSSGCQQVICVDHFKGSEEHQGFLAQEKLDIRAEFYRNVGHFPSLMVLEMSSEEAAGRIDFVDMVFIDGSHDETSVATDIRLWAPKARKIVAGHDYGYDSVRGEVVKYFGRERDWGCHSIWAMMVNGYEAENSKEIR